MHAFTAVSQPEGRCQIQGYEAATTPSPIQEMEDKKGFFFDMENSNWESLGRPFFVIRESSTCEKNRDKIVKFVISSCIENMSQENVDAPFLTIVIPLTPA